MRQERIDVAVRGVWHWFGGSRLEGGRLEIGNWGLGNDVSGGGVLALQDVDLQVEAGEFVSLVGVSGCGKSTLLRLMAGLLQPSAGEVLLAGQPPAAMRAAKRISWMSQKAALLPWRTVLENVSLPLSINRQAGQRAVDTPQALLEMVGLSDFADAYPQTLSGGMQQRATLARALATGASLWLMDEPFAALDELTRARLTEELLAVWRRYEPTTVWVTHNIHEAIRLSKRVVVMTPRPGRIAGEVRVDLPYPRDDTSAAFGKVLAEVRGLLRDGGRQTADGGVRVVEDGARGGDVWQG